MPPAADGESTTGSGTTGDGGADDAAEGVNRNQSRKMWFGPPPAAVKRRPRSCPAHAGPERNVPCDGMSNS